MTDLGLQEAQREALLDKLFEAFKEWAKASNWDVSAWNVYRFNGEHFGKPVTPLGDVVSYYEAVCSLQRIAEMRAIDQGTLVSSFYVTGLVSGEPILPCQLTKQGHAAIVIWSLWDGQKCVGNAREGMPTTPAVLVSIEGCGPEDGKWTEPLKLYSLMEFGLKLGRYVPTTSASVFDYEEDPCPAGDEEIPF